MNFVEIIKYIFLGIIQGFTEPLPISSSGHLVIFKSLVDAAALKDMNFEIIVNFGSFLAICLIFKKEIIELIRDFFIYIIKKEKSAFPNFKYALLIILGTIPAIIIGLFIKDEMLSLMKPQFVGITLIITALLLYLIKDIKGEKEDHDITSKDALQIGLCQAIALLPGISRSGATIFGGMMAKLKRDTALKFAFMLYLPVSIGSMILSVSDLTNASNLNTLWLPYLLSMIASAVVTYFSAKWFFGIIKKGKLIYFSIYCFIVGLLTFIFLK